MKRKHKAKVQELRDPWPDATKAALAEFTAAMAREQLKLIIDAFQGTYDKINRDIDREAFLRVMKEDLGTSKTLKKRSGPTLDGGFIFRGEYADDAKTQI